MSNIIQTLFNTNHEQPSFLVFVIFAVIAFVVPAIARYLYESGRAGNTTKKTKPVSTAAPAAKPPRHQHKKKKR